MTASRISKNPKTDVLVVGAGPAGISACFQLARAGASVTLIDRHLKPGGKACAGGLTATAWEPAGIDPSRPPNYAQVFESFDVRSPLGSVSLERQSPLLVTVDRRAWSRSRIEQLEALGVNVHFGERLVGLDSGSAHTSDGQRKFGFLVAADGARSRARRLLGLESGLVMRAWQARISATVAAGAGLRIDSPTVWFDPRFLGSGYAWAFPWRDEIRLGLGASAAILERTALKRTFFDWTRRLGIDPAGGRVEAGTIGCGYLGHRFGRIYLAGDAAGLASPLTGEGIGQALVSGDEVGREIIDPNYRSNIIPGLAARHRRTHDVLSHPWIRGPLYTAAPGLLRVPLIREAAFDKYVV